MSSPTNDFLLGTVIRYTFNTINQAKVPATPSVAMTFAVYKNSSVVEYTLPGANVVTDFDGVVGWHRITIDTSDPFFVVGEDYSVVFTAGTVDGINLARNTLLRFSIENRNTKANVVQIAGQTANATTAVAFPASVANETTVAGRATQLSVNNIPTNPLLTTDVRLDNLDARISLRPTNPLLTNDTRLNNLDFSIAAINTAIGNLNNLSALINIYGSPLLEIPDTGTTLYAFTIVVRDNEGKLNNLDASPTLTAANALGTSRSANLSVVSNPSVGRYTFTYSVASTHAQESLRIAVSGTVSTEARYIEWIGSVVNYDTLTTLQAVQTTVNGINTKIPNTMDVDSLGRVRLQALSHSGSSIPSVGIVDELGASALIADEAITAALPAISGSVWQRLYTENWPNNSFGAGVVVGLSPQRTVAITGSHHIASVIHDVQPNAIPETGFQSNAISARVLATDGVTEIVTGVWSRDLSTFGANTAGKNLFDTVTGISTLLSRVIDGTAQLITDLGTMLINRGLATVRWSVSALQNAPTGSGGGGGTIIATVAVPQVLENTAFNVSAITMYRGCYWSFQIQDLGDLSGYPEIWFSLRKRQNDKESESTFLVSLTQGLLIANGQPQASQYASKASLTVTGEDVTIQIHQDVTQYVPPSDNYAYDLKGKNQAGHTVMLHESELFKVKRDITRRV